MKKIYKKGLIILFICYVSVIVIIGSKIIVNKRFIKNYPDGEQGLRLLFISTLNFYEPYIAPYNYGNYYYKQGRYDEAYEKYKEALKHRIPASRQCAVDINIALSIIKIAKRKNKDEEFELYKEAKGYLNDCLTLDFPEKKDDNPFFQDEDDEDEEAKDKKDELISTAEELGKKIDGMISDFNDRSGGSIRFPSSENASGGGGGGSGSGASGASGGGGGADAGEGGSGEMDAGGPSKSSNGGGGASGSGAGGGAGGSNGTGGSNGAEPSDGFADSKYSGEGISDEGKEPAENEIRVKPGGWTKCSKCW